MELVHHPTDAIDLTTTPIHLGTGSLASEVAGFAWHPDVLQAYGAAVAADGDEGRMVMVFDAAGTDDAWERHPAGDEVVVCLDGRVTVVRERDGRDDPVELGPGEATVNPRGAWHRVEAAGDARFLTITPGVGTEHRPR